jgi:hypothetical protein
MAKIQVVEEYDVPKSAVAQIAENFLDWLNQEIGIELDESGASYKDLAERYAHAQEIMGEGYA